MQYWRKQLSENVGLLNESLKYAMDSEYWSRLLYKRKILHINQLIANFRWHEKAKTRLCLIILNQILKLLMRISLYFRNLIEI